MKTDLTLVELATQITDRAARKADFIVPAKNIRAAFDVEDVDGKPSGPFMTLEADGQTFRVGDYAHGQIAAHLEIPNQYYRRMLSTQPELLTQNVNTWLGAKNGERRMIRTLDGTARAFLSDKFARLDDDAFAESVLPAIGAVPGSEILSCSITEERTYIKFVSDKLRRDIKAGDTIRFGVCFSNSEVGAGALSASLFTERLICTNGMISTEDVFATRHVGQRAGGRDLSRIFKLDTIAAEGKATLLKTRDFIADLLTDRIADAHVAKLRELASIEVRKPSEAVERLAKAHGLSETEGESVLAHLIRGADLSAFGLVQAVTRTAEDAPTYARATELERLGGKLVSETGSKVTIRELALAA